ncbi:MAG: CocE/NonD family hydrolase, partial [Candidatus Sulfotelmatobacter sp.]
MKFAGKTFALCLAALALTSAAPAQQKQYTDDLNEKFQLPAADRDYTKREVMVPMRDGVKLFTVIWVPKGAHDAPMVLTRTPYDAAHHVGAPDASHLIDALPLAEKNFVKAGYIRIY